jgi:hypothetical protein
MRKRKGGLDMLRPATTPVPLDAMTLMDFMAVMALQTINDGDYLANEYAELAYDIAAAMLKEREKRMA